MREYIKIMQEGTDNEKLDLFIKLLKKGAPLNFGERKILEALKKEYTLIDLTGYKNN